MQDTPLSEIEYGKTIHPIVGGKVTTRHFKILHCKNPECGKQLLVRVYGSGSRKGQLYSTGDHNKRLTCGSECQAVLNQYYAANEKRQPISHAATLAINSFLYAGAR